jgi:DNA topoisomerase I
LKDTLSDAGGYTLVICEKPDAAKRVSEALSDGSARSSEMDGTIVYRFSRGDEAFVVCSALGHLYSVSDPLDERSVYPVFDLEWYGSNLVGEGRADAQPRISAIRKLAEGASKFVNACDFDVEGETIGFNILRYACSGKENEALRAKFSTLTKDELVQAFNDARPQAGNGLALAGRARHAIDFVWGVNLSRMLSQSARGTGHRYRTISMGRVQGPTLGFLVQRERDICEFVPLPFWKLSGVFEGDGKRFVAQYSRDKVETYAEAEKIRAECAGRRGVVASVARSEDQVGAPTPFNIGDLQKEAYRVFGYSPSRTLRIAESLYLGALISYPRTDSQKLPQSIGHRAILTGLTGHHEYAKDAGELLGGSLRTAQGWMIDQAHPAIHPTGERPRRGLDSSEAALFDLVVRRYLAAFGAPARREVVNVRIAVGNHQFGMEGARTVRPGWMRYYGRYAVLRDVETPTVSEGEELAVVDVRVEEKFGQKPFRYNQSSLLEKMERERIGTKATRADIISTLVTRGYVSGQHMEVTPLGISVVEVMKKYAAPVVTTELTRGIEEKLEAIESGAEGAELLLRETVRSLAEQLVLLNANEDRIGLELDSSLSTTEASTYVLGRCPVCGTGRLVIIRSRKTKKRFAGCSNYTSGCRASAPLPQRGTLKPTSKTCEHCSWPLVYVLGGRRPWKLCVNINCPAKGGKKSEVPAV